MLLVFEWNSLPQLQAILINCAVKGEVVPKCKATAEKDTESDSNSPFECGIYLSESSHWQTVNRE